MASARNLFRLAPTLGTQVPPPVQPVQMPVAAAATPAPVPAHVPEPQEPFIEVDLGSAPLPRFTVVCRDGRSWSYPYAYVGLIECPSGDRIVIHCQCGKIDTVEVQGRGLRKVADYLTAGRIQVLFESDITPFSRNEIVISRVSVHRSAS